MKPFPLALKSVPSSTKVVVCSNFERVLQVSPDSTDGPSPNNLPEFHRYVLCLGISVVVAAVWR